VLVALEAAGVGRGDLVAIAVAPGVGLGLAAAGRSWAVAPDDAVGPDDAVATGHCSWAAAVIAAVEGTIRPRWVLWSSDTAVELVRVGVRIATSWDIAAVHRLRFGGWTADPGRAWAGAHALAQDDVPTSAPPDLFNQSGHDGDPEEAVRPDGHLRAEWVNGGWSESLDRVMRWAELAAQVANRQQALLSDGRNPALAATARSESAAELLCAELSVDGLPMDRSAAVALVADIVGPRPAGDVEAAAQRVARDAEVLRHVSASSDVDLRSPGQVKALLARAGIDVPDTRAARLTPFRDAHPLVPALLAWRKAERVATTYGYSWLDEHLGDDGRLRGAWSGSDGAAGRMTASAGLHNMPAELRPAVIAEPGQVFVRADLGQIEPRVLAAVSGDTKLARASQEADMYLPVAAQLGVDRPTAKVAVLGAMYGQTTGHGAQALRRLKATYPVAMAYLTDADRAAQAGTDLRTYGGRLVRMGPLGGGPADTAARAAARGRYGRNAVVQGAAAELFKVWAATVRARGAAIGARIVLCLHDELLVHVPFERADEAARLVERGLAEAVARWAPDDSVRFLADISVIGRWSDAKG
jgi:DNA polymerase I